MKHASFAAIALVASSLLPSAAQAAQIIPVSYSMPNGDGTASGGSFNYWDAGYSGSGATTTDGALLSGGLGKLTDGVVSTSPWYTVSNLSGTGEYVGWYSPVTLDPTVTFFFSGVPTITSIDIQLDNTQVGGVFAPAAILIDGVSAAFTAPSPLGTVSFTGLNLTGPSHTIQFQQTPGTWTFVSEITFDGAVSAAPEPATWTMMIVGFGMGGAALRRRRKSGNAALA